MRSLLRKIIISSPVAKAVAVGSLILTIATTAVAATMVTYGGFVLAETIYTGQDAFPTYDLLQYKPVATEEEATPDFEEVQKLNKDTVAWLTLDDTYVDYPVVQGKDDLEYATKDIYGNYSLTGSIYLKTENASNFKNPYSVIFGHHMDNGAMFGDIQHFTKKEYFDTHEYGSLTTPDGFYTARVFAALQTDAYDKMIYDRVSKRTEEDIDDLIEYLRQNAIQFSEERYSGGKHIIALSTCSSSATNGRDVIFCELTPGLEDIVEATIPLNDPRIAKGHDVRYDKWALLNLICLVCTVYLTFPLHLLLTKFRRKKKMNMANESLGESRNDNQIVMDDNGREQDESNEDVYYEIKPFVHRFRVGFVIEVILSVIALIIFVLTQDLRLPITIIDKWTPWMILLLFATWLIDVRLIRYRKKQADNKRYDKNTEN